MANIRTVFASIFLFASIVSLTLEMSDCFLVKSKVSCLDCHHNFDFSGIKILLKCDGDRKPSTAIAAEDGGFQAELPAGDKSTVNCIAKLQGGPEQLYAHEHNIVSQVITSEFEPNTFTTSNPLSFSLSCPKPTGDIAGNMIRDSKTVDFPGIGGFGFPPTGLLFPFLPIIGIP